MKYRIISVTPFQQNCSLVWDAQTMQGALIDPGGDEERLLAAAQQAGVTLTRLLLTHGHVDHAGAARTLADRLGIPLEGPQEEDKFWLDRLPDQAAMFGFPETAAFLPDRWLNDGDRVQIGTLSLDVIHCPGHTPGHVVFHHAPSQLAFVGDVLFKGSIGRSDFPRGDHDTLIRSIRERLFPLGDAVTFVPGHGPVSTFGHERRSNPFVAD
jgi:glyoxylase-like metal-dependent hydrolase (beta-lactamase superfamily II)